MKLEKRTYIILVLVIVGLVITFLLATMVVPRVLVSLTKAAPATKMSVKDSYVLGEKILAKADGKDSCEVNVFIMDSSGKGVSGKRVELIGGGDIKAINDVSNNEGKASFKITSETEGQFSLTANVGGVELTRGVKVTFRN